MNANQMSGILICTRDTKVNKTYSQQAYFPVEE